MTFPPYDKPSNRRRAAVSPCRELKEAGKAALPPYGEPFGFFDGFLPRNGCMAKAASFSFSGP